MNPLAKLALIAALIFTPQLGFGQETPATDQTFPTGTTAEPQVGQTYFVKAYDDWQHLCVKAENGEDPCHVFQAIDDGTGNAIAEINLFKLPEGGVAIAGATIITPLRTLLTSQLVLGIDQAAPRQYPFNWCEEVGCVARVGFTGPELESLEKGGFINLQIQSADNPGNPINLKVSLKGFTAAYKAANK